MHLRCLFVITCIASFSLPVLSQDDFSTSDFPGWRGQQRNGIVDSPAVTEWSKTDNIQWRAPLPGRGHGSATVLGKRVLITAADLESDAQYVLCFDRDSGKPVWDTVIHRGGLKTKGNRKQNKKASLASTTVATDGKKLFVNFLNDEAVWTTAVSLEGKILWQTKITDYVVHQGYGSSPVVYKDLLIVSADNKGGGAVVALDRESGKEVWRHKRPKKPNYPSPAIVHAAGKDQVIMIGCNLVTSLDPLTGKINWEVKGATTECVVTTVTDGKHVFTSGGYPKNHISAVAADGSGEIVWEINSRAYVPSFLHHEGYLYVILDAGVAVCFNAADGSEVWKERLGGTFSASLVMSGGLIYATNESGRTFIYRATPDKFDSVAENELGDSAFATMAIAGGRIFTRVAHQESGKRKEYLYCIGTE